MTVNKTNNRKLFNVQLEKEYVEKFNLISKKEHRKKADLIRKWIDENFKEEYRD